ncbi:MAG: TetR/AcrR family transcriptional regulator [Candidatus Dormibacteria bacterium]|jgi:AcrR family transcriptional regulator
MVPFVKRRHAPMLEPAPTSRHPALETAPVPSHPLRADARRNREAILAAAEVEFGAHGPDVAIDDIARHAGLGVGTLYRHFPTKADLLGALVTEHLGTMVEAARAAAQTGEPGPAFFAFLRYAAGEFVAFRALADVIAASGIDLANTKGPAHLELMVVIAELLARAQEAEQVRGDVDATDLTTLMGALCQSEAVAGDPVRLARCVDLMCDALRPARPAATGNGT